jgi:hypothetical protein
MLVSCSGVLFWLCYACLVQRCDAFYTRRSTWGFDSPENENNTETLSSISSRSALSSMNEFLFFHRMLRAKAKEQTFENFSFCNWHNLETDALVCRLSLAKRGLFTRGFNELDCRAFRFVIHFALSLAPDYYVTRDLSFLWSYARLSGENCSVQLIQSGRFPFAVVVGKIDSLRDGWGVPRCWLRNH